MVGTNEYGPPSSRQIFTEILNRVWRRLKQSDNIIKYWYILMILYVGNQSCMLARFTGQFVSPVCINSLLWLGKNINHYHRIPGLSLKDHLLEKAEKTRWPSTLSSWILKVSNPMLQNPPLSKGSVSSL